VLGDAVALTGIRIMSFTTPLLCAGMRWRPRLIEAPHMTPHMSMRTDLVPSGTVVIKSSNECFTVVECDEPVARLLYFHPEYIDYVVSSFTGRGLSGTVGGLTPVGSIVMFGNAVWTIKAALAVTYTVLNLLYWVAAILPVRLSWHIDPFISPPHITEHSTFTQCLWTTIYTTKQIDWVREHVPKTEAWSEWLLEAKAEARDALGSEEWDAQGALTNLIDHYTKVQRRQPRAD
jgi:hypothetical protein